MCHGVFFLLFLGESETCKEYYDDYWIFGEEGSGETESEVEEDEDEEGSGSGSGDKGIKNKIKIRSFATFNHYFRADQRRTSGNFRRETLQTRTFRLV